MKDGKLTISLNDPTGSCAVSLSLAYSLDNSRYQCNNVLSLSWSKCDRQVEYSRPMMLDQAKHVQDSNIVMRTSRRTWSVLVTVEIMW